MGYAGGTTPAPTYHNIGDHAETLQVDYDPEVISYTELLALFWSSHRPIEPPWSRQYMSAIFTHDDDQQALAVESKEAASARLRKTLYTEIAPLRAFTWAEDYHQKYRLRRHPSILAALQKHYPQQEALVQSTAAAKLNAYLAGYGLLSELEQSIEQYNLDERTQRELLAQTRSRIKRGHGIP